MNRVSGVRLWQPSDFDRGDNSTRQKKSGAAWAPLPDCCDARLLAGGLEHFFDIVPVDQAFPERLEVGRSRVAVVDVIGVLPHVAAQDRLGARNPPVFPLLG